MMINSSGCSGGGCIDAQSPVILSTAAANIYKLQQWAEADREFLRMICQKKDYSDAASCTPAPSPIVLFAAGTPERVRVDAYNIHSGRQKYLRSYKFTRKKEPTSVVQRIVSKWRPLQSPSQRPQLVISDSSDYDHDRRHVGPSSTLGYVCGFFFSCFNIHK